MKLFPNKLRLFRVLAILSLFVGLLFLFVGLRPLWQTTKQGVSKSLVAQTAKIGAAKKPAEKSQKTEMELRKEMLDEEADFTIRMDTANAFNALIKARIKKHESYISDTVKRCAAYKKKVYDSSIDPQVKDLIWGAVLVGSEYCREVDAQPVPAPTVKPKQKKAEPRLK